MKAKAKIAAPAATEKRAQNLKTGKAVKIKKVVESSSEEEVEALEDDVLSSSDLNDENGNDSVEEDAENSNDEEIDDGSVEEDAENSNDEGIDDGSVEEDAENSNDEEIDDGSVEEDAGDSDADNEEETGEEISGWADSMAKILNSSKPKHKKVLILSRAKKDYEINTAPQKKPKLIAEELEIDGVEKSEEAPVKESEPKDSALCLKTQRKLELKQKRLEKQWDNLSRKKPEDGDIQVERALLKIATKGVVQLFNAVSFQQKTVKGKLRKVNNSEFKKDKVLSQTKDMFKSALKKSSKMDEDEDEIEIKEESDDDNISKRPRKSGKDNAKKPTWQALQDDFMLDAKMKDWDRSSDSGGD